MLVHRQPQLIEQSLGNDVIMRAVFAGRNADIGAGPDEAVKLAGDDPAPLAIQPEMPLHRLWHLQSVAIPFGLAVRDGRDNDFGLACPFDARQNDDHRPVLQPLFLPCVRLARPEIGVADDISRLRDHP